MTSSAGATNHQAARSSSQCGASAREHPAPLLEDVGRRARRARVAAWSTVSSPCHRALGHQPHLGGDALPLGHLGRGLGALELVAERARVDVVGERARRATALRRGGRSPVSSWKRRCTSGRDKVFDQLPRRGLVPRRAEHHQARAAGDRRARAARARAAAPSSSSPCTLGRQAALELADVPRARDVEREVAAAELVPHVRDRRRRSAPARSRCGTCRHRTAARGGSRRCGNCPSGRRRAAAARPAAAPAPAAARIR